ncbi:MAG: penicillin-binding protein [bacterium]|nr:penicillin-binding protein [bacterium]
MSPIHHLKPRGTRSYGGVTTQTPTDRAPEFSPIPKKRGRKIFNTKKLITYGAIALGGCFIFGTIAVAIISRDLPDPNKLTDRQIAQSTKIYDRTGEHILYEIFQDQKRTTITLDQMSTFLPKAVVAIEDKHFYEHGGIRLPSILRALFNNVIGRSAGSGGASTITQQLIKNAIIGNNPGFVSRVIRKIKEVVLAPRLEKKYTKDQILQMYLNEIPFGSTNYGAEAAAQTYFHKKAADLNLAEASTMAAMIQAPSYYLNNSEKLRARRDYVLGLMVTQNYSTQAETDEAKKVELKMYRTTGIFAAPHFVLYVKQLLADQFGETTVDTGGLKVITTLDYEKQKLAEATVKELGDKYAKEFNANNAALVSMDPRTGQILAMVGSRDFFNDEINGQFNVAVLGRRQPGSSFKPFVYTYAFEKGYTPDTVLYDVVTNFEARDGKEYIPKNYDNKEHGLVTARKALQGSLNIPAVQMLYLVGTENMIAWASKFGYTTFTGDPGLSLVLGGAEVNLLEHTNGYATLANNGVYNAPSSILQVEDMQGNNLYEWKQEEGTEAVAPEIAATITSVLTDDVARAFTFGRNSTLTLPGRPVAAKTGTTNNYFDAWTLGYTPSIATGVWVGNTQPATMKGGGNTLAGRIWNTFMKGALATSTVEQFPVPPPNDATKPILRGADGGITLKLNRLNGRIATSSTPEMLIVEKTFLPPHTILQYVVKDDPRGPAPSNPADDSQYAAWEEGLHKWIERENAKGNALTLEEPPTELDDTVANPELLPTIGIIAPTDGQTLASRQINIQITATAPRGVAQVAYYLDDNQIGVSRALPFELNYYAKNLLRGEHNLKITAADDQGNATSKIIKINLQAPDDPPSAEWLDGDSVVLRCEDFPRVMQLTPFRWDSIKDIKIFLSKLGSTEKLIYTFDKTDQIFNTGLSLTWKTCPGAGDHALRAETLDIFGKKSNDVIEVRVE